ncbi:MAG: aminotransferase class I/II-fold pyridoxal phosphate-dependent enzyme [Lachnospiraceae bacterium]|nr:aminotransferase class I/II-fold pyridoxal phosphate-dependent enzyme [Lachnospiraceae bacterium]
MHGGDIYRNKVHMDFSVNLNPAGTPAAVTDAIRSAHERADRYPDPDQEQVRMIIADAVGVQSENIVAGNGASELIMAAVRAADPKKALLFEPCFSGYRHALQAARCEVKQYVTEEGKGFSITAEAVEAIEKDVDLVFVCDPLCPAGLHVEESILKMLLRRAEQCGATVILDESFYLLSERSAMTQIRIRQADQMNDDEGIGEGGTDRVADLIRKYDNMIVIRSLTKVLAIPGIRCGYAIGNGKVIEKMKQQLPEWNLSVVAEEAIKAGIRTICETDYLKRSVEMIRQERAYLTDALRSMKLTVFDSKAPYLLFTGPKDLYAKLLQQGILIRDCSDYEGLGKGYFRIGIKSRVENEMLAEAMRGILDAL